MPYTLRLKPYALRLSLKLLTFVAMALRLSSIAFLQQNLDLLNH